LPDLIGSSRTLDLGDAIEVHPGFPLKRSGGFGRNPCRRDLI
jgi:hypothetical protein